MADNKEELEFSGGIDKFDDFDSSWDTDSEFNEDNMQDNRTPVTQALTGFKDSIVNQATDANTQLQFAKKALPKEFSSSVSIADGIVGDIKKDTEQAYREVKPQLHGMVKSVEKSLPEGALKRAASKLGKKFSPSGSDVDDSVSRGEERNKEMTDKLSSIFDTQSEDKGRAMAHDVLEKGVDRKIADKRHGQNLMVQGSVDTSLKKLVSYNTNITAKYQRTALELKFKSLFLQRDITKSTLEHHKIFREQLSAISKNTSLPEFVKLQSSEAWDEFRRDTWVSAVGTEIFDTQAFVSAFGKNIKSKLREKITTLKEGVSDVKGVVDDVADARDLVNDPDLGVSKANLAGDSLGGLIGGFLFGFGANKLKNVISKSKVGSKLNSQSRLLSKQFPEKVYQELEKRSQLDGNEGFLGKYTKTILGAGANLLQSTTLENDRILREQDRPQDPAVFDQLTYSSINTVIPTFLSQAVQELRIIRTGDESIESESYSFSRGTFFTSSQAGSNIKSVLEKSTNNKDFNKRVKNAYDAIVGDKDISPKAKSALFDILKTTPIEALNEKGFLHNIFSLDSFDDKSRFKGVSSKSVKKELRNLISQRKSDSTIDEQSDIAEVLLDLRADSTDLIATMRHLINVYGTDPLIRMGLIKATSTGFEPVTKKINKLLRTGKVKLNSTSTIKGLATAKHTTNSIEKQIIEKKQRNTTNIFNIEGLDQFTEMTDTLNNIGATSVDILDVLSRKDTSTTADMASSISDQYDQGAADNKRDKILKNILKKMDKMSINMINAQGIQSYVGDALKNARSSGVGFFGKDGVVGGIMENVLQATTGVMGIIGMPITGAAKLTGNIVGGLGNLNPSGVAGRFNPLKLFGTDGPIWKLGKGGVSVGGNLISSSLGMVSGLMGGIASGLKGILPVNILGSIKSLGVVKDMTSFLLKKAEKLTNPFNRAMDINIPGFPDNPVLTKAGMKAGWYKNAGPDGKIIRRVGDIRGAVVEAGTENVIISVDMLKQGLFDNFGSKLDGPWKRIVALKNRVVNSLMFLKDPKARKDKLKSFRNTLNSKAGSIKGSVIDYGTSFKNKVAAMSHDASLIAHQGLLAANSASSAGTLVKILKLLDDRLEDNNLGYRKGSWRWKKLRESRRSDLREKIASKKARPRRRGRKKGGLLGDGLGSFLSVLEPWGKFFGTKEGILSALLTGGTLAFLNKRQDMIDATSIGIEKTVNAVKSVHGKLVDSTSNLITDVVGMFGGGSNASKPQVRPSFTQQGTGEPPGGGSTQTPEYREAVGNLKTEFDSYVPGKFTPMNPKGFPGIRPNPGLDPVDMANLNPAFRHNLLNMAAEYKSITGRDLTINEGFRNRSRQHALYECYKKGINCRGRKRVPAARPGTGMHEYGLAADLQTVDLNRLNSLGLLEKYGFFRPHVKETWHMESTDIRSNKDKRKAKRNPQWATNRIMRSINKVAGMSGGDRQVLKQLEDNTLPMVPLDGNTPPTLIPAPPLPDFKGGVVPDAIKDTTNGLDMTAVNKEIESNLVKVSRVEPRPQPINTLPTIPVKPKGVTPDDLTHVENILTEQLKQQVLTNMYLKDIKMSMMDGKKVKKKDIEEPLVPKPSKPVFKTGATRNDQFGVGKTAI